MSDCDGLRRRKNVVAKEPSAEACSDDVMTADDDVKRSRDNCVDVIRGTWGSIISRLYQPVDASSLAVFRMLFGEYSLQSIWDANLELGFVSDEQSDVYVSKRVTAKSADVGPYVFEK